MNDELPVKRWTAKRKTAVVMDIFKGKTTLVEVARQPVLPMFPNFGGEGTEPTQI
jgi:hypothetical protein